MSNHLMDDGRAPDVQANGLKSQHINLSLSIIIAAENEEQNVLPLVECPEKVFTSRAREVIIADASPQIKSAIERITSFIVTFARLSRSSNTRVSNVVAELSGRLRHTPRKHSHLKRNVLSRLIDWFRKPSGMRATETILSLIA